MKMMKSFTGIAVAILSLVAGAGAAQAQPNPMLYLISVEPYSTPAGNFMRYTYDVFNKDQYPAAMFAAAPALPPCGSNHNSSRSWVDFFENRTNRRIYGFCALGSPANLGRIWFGLPEGQLPPSYVYIKIIDRQTNTTYTSNLAETTL